MSDSDKSLIQVQATSIFKRGAIGHFNYQNHKDTNHTNIIISGSQVEPGNPFLEVLPPVGDRPDDIIL